MKQTVVMVWTQNCTNCKTTSTENYWGLGDLIRGTIKLFQLSKTMNFQFVVNTILHPVSLHLQPRTTEYDELIMQNKNNIEFVLPGNVENYINHYQNKKDTIYFLTNDFCDETNITEECRDFVKTILAPSNELSNLLNNFDYLTIPEQSRRESVGIYNILHMRFGDEFIINKDMIDDNVIDIVKKRITDNSDDIFVCDSYFVKDRLKYDGFFANANISFIDLDGGHIGYEQNADKIKNTLLEFFVISKSKKIKTYSVYPWTSGFVFWTAKLYDIPLIKIAE